MKRLNLLIVLLLFLGLSVTASNKQLVKEKFKHPSNEYKPWVYWYWLNGNINKDGLMADLEAMHNAGIGTAMVFDIGIGVQGKTTIRSKEWYEYIKSVILKADELGMQLGFHGPGWANTGGPWITVENSMKELIWNETIVSPKSKNIKLPECKGIFDYYRDIAVIAYPKIKGDDFKVNTNNCYITDTLGVRCNSLDDLFDNNRETIKVLPGSFEVHFDKPQSIRNIDIRAPHQSRFFVADVFAFDKIKGEFVYVTELRSTYSGLNDRPGMASAAFEDIKSDRFRFKFKVGWENETTYSPEVHIQELNMNTGYRLHMWSKKAGFGSRGPNSDYVAPITSDDVVNPSDIIDITDKLLPDGTLNWRPESGEWTVIRMGYIPTGARPGPTGPLMGTSLECDKFSKKITEIQYYGVFQPIFDMVGKDVVSRVFSNYHCDSYEAGWQNWSDVIPNEFRQRNGYDIKDYLVALTGRVIGSIDKTEGFLWDFRRTLSDCYADNHMSHLSELAHRDGMIFSTEAYDGMFEDLQAAGRVDMPMTEIWNSHNPELRPRSGAAYAAHTYGRTRVGSEQFTGMGGFTLHPWKMKHLTDASMSYGINNFVMHVYTHQPWTNPKLRPGNTLGPWGAHYDRGNTWWKESGGWHEYLARCQYMLRQGQPVADILYFMGDDAPEGGGNSPVSPPIGFDADAVNGEILRQLTAKNNDIILPNGKIYKYLVMPEEGMVSLSSLIKIAELVEGGATIVGRLPQASKSLKDENGKMLFKRLVDELFNSPFTSSGRVGRVFKNKRVEDIIAMDSYSPDFKVVEYNGLNVKYNHRKCDDSDIYYVTNNSNTNSGVIECQFRVEGMMSEEWNPQTGQISSVLTSRTRKGVTTIPIHFDQGETKFIVFTKSGKETNKNIRKIELDDENILTDSPEKGYTKVLNNNGVYSLITNNAGNYSVVFDNGEKQEIKIKSVPQKIELNNNWIVRFAKDLMSPMPESAEVIDDKVAIAFDELYDWSKSDQDGVKYYSGTATYTKKVEIKKMEKDVRYVLDLGEVNVIAKVFVNGNDLGALWKPPFRVDITDAIKKGENDIVVEVTNLWPNRMIGDEQYPDDVSGDGNWKEGGVWSYPEWVWNQSERPEKRRVSFVTFKHWKATDKLQPSGLVGPVVIDKVVVRQF